MSYRQDANTLLDGLRLLHKVGDPGHDGGAVVAGPVAEEALHLLKIFLVFARDVTAMIIIIIIIIFFNNDYPPCKDQGAHRRRQLR